MTDTNFILSKPKNKSFAKSALEYHKCDNDNSLLLESDSNSVSKLIPNLMEAFLRMPDEEFYDLVRKRLKLPILTEDLVKEDIEKEREYWTEDFLADQLSSDYQKQLKSLLLTERIFEFVNTIIGR
jgi:hypothetical protein